MADLIINGEVVNNSVTGEWLGRSIPRDTPTALYYTNNSITSVNSSGYILQAGDEEALASINNLNGAVITGNKITWNGTLLADTSTHGMFLGYNINYTVKYNYLDKTPYGILPKDGAGASPNMTYTSGGIAYNIVKNSRMPSNSKGMNGVFFYNNTFYNNISSDIGHIVIYPNGVGAAPTGIRIKNNIFYSKYTSYKMIRVDSLDSFADFQSDYNIFWCEDGAPVFEVNGSDISFAQWQALGYDLHSVVMNPNFINTTSFVPTARLDYGINVGTTWQTGLSTTAVWTVGVAPATVNQNGAWQVGARIYGGEVPVVADYYLAPNGNDNTGNGSITLPWFTLEKVWSVLMPGNIVYLRGGNYYYTSSQELLNKNGSLNNLISIFAYPGETPVITKSGTYNSQQPSGIYLEGNYFHWKGIEITGFNQIEGSNNYKGFRTVYSSHNKFELINYHHNGGGFEITDGCDDVLVLNSDFHHNYDPLTSGDLYGNSDGACANPFPGSTITFRGCRFWSNSDDGLDLYGASGLIIIDKCWAWMNGYREDGVTSGGNGAGFKLGDTADFSTTHLRTITNTLSFHNRSCGYSMNDGQCIAWVYNNVAYHNGDNAVDKPGFEFAWNYPNIVHILKNNIAYAHQDGSYEVLISAASVQDHNSWNGTVNVSGTDFVSLNMVGVDGGRLPNGDLPVLNFLKLAAGSDLISAGVPIANLTTDGAGNAWDLLNPSMGAYQYGSAVAVIPTVVTTSVTNISITTSTSGGNITSDGGASVTARGVCWSTSANPTIALTTKTTNGTGTGIFVSNITGLSSSTTYYYRAYATNSAGTAYGSEYSFTTLSSVVLPTVTTTAISNISWALATSGGNATADGGATITQKGVCWSTTSNPTVTGSRTMEGSGTGVFTSYLMGLNVNTLYYVRAYATNSAGTAYGNQVTFRTLNYSTPTITTTTPITNITQVTATGGGTVTNTGGRTIAAWGVCWRTTSGPLITNAHTTDSVGGSTFTSSITGLAANTLYYVRAYLTTTLGVTVYGANVQFRTLAAVVIPTVTTTAITNIARTTASSGGNVTSAGNGVVSARGVCWATTQNPTIVGSKTTDGSGTGVFTSGLTMLAANTTYYVRAWASNTAGTGYGTQVSFTTSNFTIPTVVHISTYDANITNTTAFITSKVTLDGGSTVTDFGVCWSTTSTLPTIADPHTRDGGGARYYSSFVSPLIPNTLYYFRSYATNAIGTAYSVTYVVTTMNFAGVVINDLPSYHKWSTSTGLGYGALYNWYCTQIKNPYGLLYNWYAASKNGGTGEGSIAPTGWHVPSNAEWDTLVTYLGGSMVAGGKLKEIGFVHWDDPNTGADNSSGFTAIGGGNRVVEISGTSFQALKQWFVAHSIDPAIYDPEVGWYMFNGIVLSFNNVQSSVYGNSTQYHNQAGASIRCIANSTTKTHGQTGTVTDIDGNVYQTICIGTQEWMTSNLKVTKFNDGTAIPEVQDNTAWAALTTGARCWYDNIAEGSIAPAGWHVPTDAELVTLISYLGPYWVAGGKMKETGTVHWEIPNVGATNSSGFSARGQGLRSQLGFASINIECGFWSATEYDASNAYQQNLYSNGEDAARYVNGYPKAYGMGIRCLKNSTILTNGQTSSVTDIDGNVYQTICIGTQEWMTSNLKVTKYNDGTAIPNVTDNTAWANLTTGAMCYYNNDINNA
jgi:uncharacterized protein (TIGR02145 family)